MNTKYFETRYSQDPGRRKVWKAVCEYLQPFIPLDSALLEIGPGYCDFINQIRAARKYAIDANPDVSEFCAPDVSFMEGEAPANLSLPASSIDVVFASNLLEHLTDEKCALLFDALERILKDNGKLILIQPNYHYCYKTYWDDFTHVKAYSHESLADLVRSRGYEILLLEKRFLPFSFKSFLPKSYRLTKLYLSSFYRPLAKQLLLVAQR